MELLECAFPLRVNFDDLSGITLDIDRLNLTQIHRDHTCAFCLYSKQMDQGYEDCVRNRNAVARIVQKKQESMQGTCHMGLFEMVQPLVYHGHYLGKFHYGQVLLKGSIPASRKRLRTYCRRHGLDTAPYLEAFNAIPVITPEDVPFYRRTLELLSDFTEAILLGHGLPSERYNTYRAYALVLQNRNTPLMVRRATEFANAHYTQALTLQSTAKALGRPSEYLGRLFKKSMGIGFHKYLQSVRLDHARYLLQHSARTITEISFIVGFQDPSHFNKAFKRVEGMTPGRYRERVVIGRDL